MKTISSSTNPLIKHIKKLHTRKYRTQFGLFIAEGIRTITTCIENGMKPMHLLCTEETMHDAPSDEYTIVSNALMRTISTATTPSGLLAVFTIPSQPSLDNLQSGIVLAGIQDPGNMGTLIRTTAAMGFNTVVCVESTDPWSPKVIQATAGTIAQCTIFQLDWNTLITNKKNLTLAALVVQKGNNPNILDKKNTLLVVGSEAHGIPEAWINDCNKRITLPMPGNTESLNAAIAGSIALYLLAMR